MRLNVLDQDFGILVQDVQGLRWSPVKDGQRHGVLWILTIGANKEFGCSGVLCQRFAYGQSKLISIDAIQIISTLQGGKLICYCCNLIVV